MLLSPNSLLPSSIGPSNSSAIAIALAIVSAVVCKRRVVSSGQMKNLLLLSPSHLS